MTRLAILADIHGNLPALEAVFDDLSQFRVDHTIVAGDVINWGPFSAAVLERLAAEDCAIIRGNNEYYLLDYGTARAPIEWSDRDSWPLLPWLNRQLRGRWHHRVAAWPDSLALRYPDAPPVRVVHGSARSPWEAITPLSTEDQTADMLTGVEEGVVIAAHSHLAMACTVGRWQIFNPGSVGVPLDGAPGASYMLLDGDETGWRPTFRRLPFDRGRLFEEFERQGFVEECGVIGQLVVEEFRTARLQVHPFVRWWRTCHPEASLSRGLLQDFAAVNKWQFTPQAYHLNVEGAGEIAESHGFASGASRRKRETGC